MDPMGAHYRYLIRQGRAKSVPLSYHLRAQPAAEHLFFWDAFWELSTTRQLGMSIGPIPYDAMLTYAQENSLRGERFESFRRLMRALDTVFLKMAMLKPEVEEDD